MAAINGHTLMAQDLVQSGARLSVMCPRQRTALDWAAAFGKGDTARMLLAAMEHQGMGEWALNKKDGDGRTPLMIAATNGQSTLELFLGKVESSPSPRDHVIAAMGCAQEKLGNLQSELNQYEAEAPRRGMQILVSRYGAHDGGPMARAARNVDLLKAEYDRRTSNIPPGGARPGRMGGNWTPGRHEERRP